MSLEKIHNVSGTIVHVPGDDIDTDRIIPARFMKCVTFDGLGEFLFYDMKFDENGDLKDHPLNEPQFKNASIMLTGSNLDAVAHASTHHNLFFEPVFVLLLQEISLKFSLGIRLILGCLVYPLLKKTEN